MIVLSAPGSLEAFSNEIFCIYCGKEALNPEKFCAFCGKRLPRALSPDPAYGSMETSGPVVSGHVKAGRVFVKDEYLAGKTDGGRYATGNAVWFMGGCLGGALYVLPGALVTLAAYSVNPILLAVKKKSS